MAYENPWLTVWHDVVDRPDGSPGVYGVVHFANLAAGVVVLDDLDRVLLVGQHRYSLDAYSWEIPEGGVAAGESPLDGARRELVEESGLSSFDFDDEPLSLDAHAVEFCSDRGTVHHLDVRFLATADPDASHATSEESLDVRWWPWDALPTEDEDMHELVRLARSRWVALSTP